MNKIGVTFVSPCCGRRLGINHVDEIVVVDPPQVDPDLQFWTTNAMCCATLGSGLYDSRAAAEAGLAWVKKVTVDASVHWSMEDLYRRHEREEQEMRDAIEDFQYLNSEQSKIDSEGPQPREGIAGYSEACGYWD